MPQYQYAYQHQQDRVGYDSFSFFKNFKSIPTAEKNGMIGLLFCIAAGLCTGSGGVFACTTALAVGKYLLLDKPKQDEAVDKYYDEIDGVYDPRSIHYIYQNSKNVEAMGGFDAIHNACATRIFSKK